MNTYILVGILGAIAVLLLAQVVLTIRQSRRSGGSPHPSELQQETTAASPAPDPAAAIPSRSTREILQDLASRFDPAGAGGQRLVLQIFFTDQIASPAWYLTTSGGRCKLSEGYASSATTTITTPSQLWSLVVAGHSSADAAYIAGKIQVDGDSSLLTRLRQIFPPPESEAAEPVAETEEPEPVRAPEPVLVGPPQPFVLAAGEAPIDPYGPAQEAIARLTLNLSKAKGDQATADHSRREPKDPDPAPGRASC